MKVLHLSHLATQAAPTGAERVLDLLACGLSDRGHRVVVAAPGRWHLSAARPGRDIATASITNRCLWLVQAEPQPLWLQAARAARYLLPDPGVNALRRLLAEFEPDVVHVNCLPHVRGAATANACGLPVVWHVHEILPPGWRSRWFATRLRRDASRIVAVSEAVAGWLRNEGLGDLVEVVHNGIEAPDDVPARETARDQFDLPRDAHVVGLFGQLVRHKGSLQFVEAAHRSASESGRLWFLIAGHGPATFLDELRAAITDGPAADRIRLVPPQPEIWPLLAAVDVVAITTLWPDPLPRVVMEAMAVGRPVVGYAGGGVPEMVVDGVTGMLVQPGDVEGLANAWVRLAGNRDLARTLGDEGSVRARELFGVDRHVDRMEAILLAAGGAGRTQA